jgi:hypothetical protein
MFPIKGIYVLSTGFTYVFCMDLIIMMMIIIIIIMIIIMMIMMIIINNRAQSISHPGL